MSNVDAQWNMGCGTSQRLEALREKLNQPQFAPGTVSHASLLREIATVEAQTKLEHKPGGGRYTANG